MQSDQRGQKCESDCSSYGSLGCCRRLDSQHDRRKPIEKAMSDYQGDMMDREYDKRDQPEEVQASGSLPTAEQSRNPGESAGDCGRHRQARRDLQRR